MDTDIDFTSIDNPGNLIASEFKGVENTVWDSSIDGNGNMFSIFGINQSVSSSSNSRNQSVSSISTIRNQPSSSNMHSNDQSENSNDHFSSKRYKSHKKKKEGPICPMTAYSYFSKDEMSTIKTTHPELTNFGDRSRYVGLTWRNLDQTEKEKYHILAFEDKDRYIKEKMAYSNFHTDLMNKINPELVNHEDKCHHISVVWRKLNQTEKEKYYNH